MLAFLRSRPPATRSRPFATPFSCALAATVFLAVTLPGADDADAKGEKTKGCPAGMASIRGKYCIDQYEASTVEIVGKGKTKPHSPFAAVEGLKVKAISKKGV